MIKQISDTATNTDTLGDGYYDANGMCEKPDDTNRRCLSTGQCRRCQFVTTNSENTTVNRYEGCEGETSEEPICDAVANTTIIDFANSDYVSRYQAPACVKCKKRGNCCFARYA